MNLQLNNTIIVVTGAAKGIGAGIAEALAAEGAIPVIIGRNEKDNQVLVDKLTAQGYQAAQVVAELTNPLACTAAIQEVADKFGRIDGVVNNAGVNDGVGLESGSYELFIESLHKNLVITSLQKLHCRI